METNVKIGAEAETRENGFDNCPLLLIDDDVEFCEILARALTREGFNVSSAKNVAEAADSVAITMPEFAIVDLCIGQESGLTAVKLLAELNSDMHIVVLTGYASIATAVEAIKLGATHYLTKPAEVEEIIDAFSHKNGNTDIPTASAPMSVKRLEWEHMQKILQEHKGNISAAARAMGMHRRTLQRKLQKRPVKS